MRNVDRRCSAFARCLAACAILGLGSCAADDQRGTTGGLADTGGAGAMAGGAFGNTDPAVPRVNTMDIEIPDTVDLGMGEECAATGERAINEIRPVDIIWAIDSSPSMAFVIEAMEMEMNNLVTTVTAAMIDVHVVFISGLWKEDLLFGDPIVGDPIVCIAQPVGSGDCANDTNLPGYHHVATECGSDGCWVGSHNALSRLIGTYDYYKSDLRMNSLKYLGAVTDDTAGDTSDFAGQAAMFSAQLEALDPGWFDDWKFFGIIDPSSGGAYQMLADMTGGMTGPVGGGDYTALFNMLAQTVTETAQLSCEWAIPEIPQEAGSFDPRKVNVTYSPGDGSAPVQFGKLPSGAQCATAPDGGWFYDAGQPVSRVFVCPQNCDVMKADLTGAVDVLFGCSTIEAPF